MKRKEIMLVAGDPSGDAHAARLIRALTAAVSDAEFNTAAPAQPLTTPLAPHFFGAGGPEMAAAGVALDFDLTAESVIGPGGLFTKLPALMRTFKELRRLAIARQPELIILVDYGEFNLRFAKAIKNYVRARGNIFFNWNPKIVQFISPQVWASRPGRAKKIARDYDLVISVIPFEKKWYAEWVPQLQVAYVGNPILDRDRQDVLQDGIPNGEQVAPQRVLLLPGSRRGELMRHAPVMLEAARMIAAKQPAQFLMVVPNEALAAVARTFMPAGQPGVALQVGDVAKALQSSTVALTKSGTITMECARFRVPAVVMYKTDPLTYLLGWWLVKVKYLGMPNLLADEAVYQEFIQGRASAANIAAAILDLLSSREIRDHVRQALDKVMLSLAGEPHSPNTAQIAGDNTARKAARAIVELMGWRRKAAAGS